MTRGSEIENVKYFEGGLEVQFADEISIRFEDCWLRDNCRCSSCYMKTNQRANHILDIPESGIIGYEFHKSALFVKWDDNHQSFYPAEFLSKFDYRRWSEGRRQKPIIWHGENILEVVARVHVDKFLGSVDGARMVFQSLLDFGFAFIENVNPTLKATETIVKALGGVQTSLFGGMWQLTAEDSPIDLAFTNLPMRSHNDSTFFAESAGLQTFHCIRHSWGHGGESTLVDGFYGALRLKNDHPEDFHFLTTFDAEAEFLTDHNHQTFSGPMIRLDPKTQDIKQIRIQAYNRAPMAFRSSAECRTYYRALKNLLRYYDDPGNRIQIKLKPGTVLIMDNFRILHGRTGFTGNRILCGGSVTRSDWLDRCRVLELIL